MTTFCFLDWLLSSDGIPGGHSLAQKILGAGEGRGNHHRPLGDVSSNL